MKKLMISLFTLCLVMTSVSAASWNAEDRVSVVGKTILEKNGLPTNTQFKVVTGAVDNSNATINNIIYISKEDLLYTGNDSEVAAVVSNKIGNIINGQASKKRFRSYAKAMINENLSAQNIITTATNSEYLSNKEVMRDEKEADITGVDLMSRTNYNPLAMIVVVTKRPGTSLEILQGKPNNTERAMNIYDYLSYNYPSRVKTGYGCKEYRQFLVYADPISKERTSNAKKLAKFNKVQAKNKANRIKSLSRYKATGLSGWDTSYALLESFANDSEPQKK